MDVYYNAMLQGYLSVTLVGDKDSLLEHNLTPE